jgi:hypothetical protein
MALKPDMVINQSDPINVTDAVAEAGYLAVLKAATGRAVGAGYNDAAKLVAPVSGTPASGTRVVGVYIGDVVNIDQTKQHRNFQKNFEAVVGEPVELLTDGWVVTNAVVGTPAAGDPAYIGANSKFSASQTNSIPAVGWFETAKDADGYAKVVISL